MGRTRSGRLSALASVLLALGLAGCGRAGALEPPPDPGAAAVMSQPAVEATPRRPKKVPIAKPSDSFVLDPLL